jgi:hypothetical protein
MRRSLLRSVLAATGDTGKTLFQRLYLRAFSPEHQ